MSTQSLPSSGTELIRSMEAEIEQYIAEHIG
jgi:hypothetical protein